jgi:hypothetical protein
MTRKSKTGDEERSGPPDQPAVAGRKGPARRTGGGSRAAGETAPAARPAVTPQSLERLRRKLKAKYH